MAHSLQAKDIENVEHTVSSFLKVLGYYRVEQISHAQNNILIIADGQRRNILIKVKIVLDDISEDGLSSPEKKKILDKAKRENREAWVAKLAFNENHELARSIAWEIVA